MSSTKVAVVTGSNKDRLTSLVGQSNVHISGGIGLAIARNLCKAFEGDVLLTSRNEALGKEAVELLTKEGLSPKYHQLDIDSQESIDRFRDFVKNTYGGLDILVNNAGIAFKHAATEPFSEQAEVTCRVNFVGTMKASNALFPLLRPHARVVNLSSSCGHLSKINGDEPAATELKKKFANPDLTVEELTGLVNNFVELTKAGNHVEHGWPNSAYNVSKVAVSALSRIQQREVDKSRPDDDILINHVHPGYVDTDMTSHKGPLTTEQGAAAATWLALLPVGETIKGAYVWHDKSILDWESSSLPAIY